MPLEFLKKLKAIFTGKSAQETKTKEQPKESGHSKHGRKDGFSSRRERDEKRREHLEMSDDTKKMLSRERRQRPQGSKRPENGSRSSSKDAPKSGNRDFQENRRPRREFKGERRPFPKSEGPSQDRGSSREKRYETVAEIDYASQHVENGDWTVDSFKVEPEEGKKRFHDFDIPVEIMHAISDLGFKFCTPIQAGSLEQAMAGANVAGRAQTGTGKTAAYLVAILTRYLRTPDKRQEKAATPRALVIAPTRELCVQICRDAQALGKYCGLRSLAVFGGMDYNKQASALAAGTVDLLAATPGRLLDFQRQHIVDLSKIDTLVIDEADRMLDMGFIPDVRRIIRALPQERQTLLYSATLNDEVMRLASQWMPNPVKVEIEPEKTANQSIEQKVYIVTSDQKFTILCHLLDKYAGQRVLVFGNRRVSTDHLAEMLTRQGYPCELLSGEVSQGHRMKVLDSFRDGSVKLVVATDVAGRGLHIADIGLVVNFELPYEAEDYVHRIGRTGRAGKVGTAVSFADEDESFIIPDIEEYIGEELKCTNPDDELLAPLPEPPKRHRKNRDGESRRSHGEGESEPAPATEASEKSASSDPVAGEPAEKPVAGEAAPAPAEPAVAAEPAEEPKAEPVAPAEAPKQTERKEQPVPPMNKKPRPPRAVVVPKGTKEQVWVPGQH